MAHFPRIDKGNIIFLNRSINNRYFKWKQKEQDVIHLDTAFVGSLKFIFFPSLPFFPSDALEVISKTPFASLQSMSTKSEKREII